MINGISNSFGATIDGLTNFELSSLTVDELDTTDVTVSNNLTVSAGGTLTLPNDSIQDAYLTDNVPLKNAANTFTQTNTFPDITVSNNLTVSPGGTLTLPNDSILDAYLTDNVPLKNTTNIFTLTNTFPRINFTDDVGTKLQYFTGYTTEIQSNILRHNVPTTATHRFAIDGSDRLTISNTEINANASNSTSGSPKLIFWKHPTTATRDAFIVRSGVNLIYSTGEIGSASTHIFQIATTDVISIGSSGIELLNGNTLKLYDSGTSNYGIVKAEAQSGSITTLIYDAESHSFKIDGVEIFRIDRDLFTGFTSNQFKDDVFIRSGNELRLYDSGNTIHGDIYVISTGNLVIEGATGQSIIMRIGGTDILTLTSSGMSLPPIVFPNVDSVKITYFTNYFTEKQGTILRTNVPTGSTHNWSLAGVDIMTMTDTALNPPPIFYTGVGTKLTYFTGATTAVFAGGLRHNIPTGNSHRFAVNATDVVQMGGGGITILTGNFLLPSGNGVKIQYNGFGGGYNIEVQTGFLRTRVPAAITHAWEIGGVDIMTMTETALNPPPIVFATGVATKLTYTTNMTTAVFGGGLRTNVPTGDSHRFSANALDIVQIDSDGLTIRSGDLIFLSGAGLKIDYNGAGAGYSLETAIGVMRTSVPTGITHAWRVNLTDVLQVNATLMTLASNINLSMGGTGIIDQTGTGSNELKSTDINGILTVTSNINMSGTGIINQTGSSTNELKNTDVNGVLTVTGLINVGDRVAFTYTTLTAPTSTQLGHVRTAVNLPGVAFSLTTNVARNCAQALLDIGVWSVTFQVCYKCTAVGGGTSSRFEYGLSTTSATFDNLFIDRQFGGAHGSNEFVYNRTTRTFTVLSGTLTIYAVIRLAFSSGTYQTGGLTLGTEDYIGMQAVRIA